MHPRSELLPHGAHAGERIYPSFTNPSAALLCLFFMHIATCIAHALHMCMHMHVHVHMHMHVHVHVRVYVHVHISWWQPSPLLWTLKGCLHG